MFPKLFGFYRYKRFGLYKPLRENDPRDSQNENYPIPENIIRGFKNRPIPNPRLIIFQNDNGHIVFSSYDKNSSNIRYATIFELDDLKNSARWDGSLITENIGICNDSIWNSSLFELDDDELDEIKESVRWDNSLITEEYIEYMEHIENIEDLFDQPRKNATVYTMIGNILIIRCYSDYSFKGPLGGYWLSDKKTTHIWKKISDDSTYSE